MDPPLLYMLVNKRQNPCASRAITPTLFDMKMHLHLFTAAAVCSTTLVINIDLAELRAVCLLVFLQQTSVQPGFTLKQLVRFRLETLLQMDEFQ